MKNEEEIKIERKIPSVKLPTKIFHKINNLILLQIINLLFIILLLFAIYIKYKKEKIDLYPKNDKYNNK